jgi:hypothetical protein
MDPDAGQEETTESQTEAARQTMAGLRAIWMATGQMHQESVGLECRPDGEGCSASLNFEGLADPVEPTADTTDDIARLRSAWKATLAREGKLADPDG